MTVVAPPRRGGRRVGGVPFGLDGDGLDRVCFWQGRLADVAVVVLRRCRLPYSFIVGGAAARRRFSDVGDSSLTVVDAAGLCVEHGQRIGKGWGLAL